MSDPAMSETTEKRVVNCPRCFESCGWCSDYRHMHGLLPLASGYKRRCTVSGMEPEGNNCPLCAGSKKVQRTITYSAIERAAGGAR